MLSPKELKKITELEKRLSLPEGFCTSILDEDDWSFVIKFHAVFEAAFTRLLAHQLGHDELRPVFARLDMSHNSFGKLAFAKALGYVEEEERRFVRKWSELRNSLVHDVTNVSFNLVAYLALLDTKAQKIFFRNFYLEDFFQPNVRLAENQDAARANPKEFMFLGALSLLWSISHYFNWADHDREVEHMKWLEQKLGQDNEDDERE